MSPPDYQELAKEAVNRCEEMITVLAAAGDKWESISDTLSGAKNFASRVIHTSECRVGDIQCHVHFPLVEIRSISFLQDITQDTRRKSAISLE